MVAEAHQYFAILASHRTPGKRPPAAPSLSSFLALDSENSQHDRPPAAVAPSVGPLTVIYARLGCRARQRSPTPSLMRRADQVIE